MSNHETEEQGMSQDTNPTAPVDEPVDEPVADQADDQAHDDAPVRRGPSVPTVVWGLLFTLVAAAVMVNQTSDVDLNLDVSAPVALLVAGAVLVVWGIAGIGRSRRTP